MDPKAQTMDVEMGDAYSCDVLLEEVGVKNVLIHDHDQFLWGEEQKSFYRSP